MKNGKDLNQCLAMESDATENVSASLIREYLSKKGMGRTLAMFDDEMPSTQGCINNRTQLMKTLNLSSAMKKNKESSAPHKTMLEVIAGNLLHSSAREENIPTTSHATSGELTIDDDVEGETMLGDGRAGVFQSQHPSYHPHDGVPLNAALQPKPAKTGTRSRGMAGPISTGLQNDGVHRQWKMGPALYPDRENPAQKRIEERKSPPSNLEPLQDPPSQINAASAKGRKQPKKKNRGPQETDSVLDALASIRNSRKRQPGASFLARDVLPPTSDSDLSDFSYNVSDSSIGSAKSRSRLPPTQGATKDTNPVHDMWDRPQSKEHSKPKHKHKSKDKALQSKSSFTFYPLDNDENDNQERSFKRPVSEFNRRQTESSVENNVTDNRTKVKNKQKINKDFIEENTRQGSDVRSDDVTGSGSSSSQSEQTSSSRDSSENKARDDSSSSYSHGYKQLTRKEPSNDDEMRLDDDVTEDLAELNVSGPVQPIHAAPPTLKIHTAPIDINTAIALKRLIFGLANKNLNAEWRYQSFSFCDIPSLQYGIVQKKGGPCGILASVQACVLQHLLFSSTGKPVHKSLQVSRKKRSECLAHALATILWRAGQNKSAIVTLPSPNAQFQVSSKFKGDNLTERLMVSTAESFSDLLRFITLNLIQFELDGSSGVILCLYSAILSRTVEGIRGDMDETNGTLMGAHEYCTQEMVNLLLTGRAISNVFNDTVELDSGTDAVTVLKGISERSDIGFLSLFEHYKSCQVGTYLKVPRLPIWVVCSESHFSVLFALNKDLLNNWRAERRFDLYYYDGLGGQDQEIKLTIVTSNPSFRAPPDDDLVPPLELCIRTKWPDAEIDWNGTDPIL